MSDLTSLLGSALAVATLESAGNREVVGLQPWQWQHGEHSLADEVMAESESVLARGGQEVAACGLVDGIAQLMARELAECLEERDVEVSSDHRSGNQHPLGGFAQSLQPAPDDAAHGVGELEILFREAGLDASVPAKHRLRVGDIEVRVLDEKRVALGRGLDADE